MIRQCASERSTLSLQGFRAVLFDLDGVITKTAVLHAAAWKQLFDDFLQRYGRTTGQSFAPFDLVHDYHEYVDGKPRYDGVRSFLASRKIVLPEGSQTDPPGWDTVCGLGKKKDSYFASHLARNGVEVYEDGVALLRNVKAHGLKTGIVSSSRHCGPVLQAVGLLDLFDVKVDGIDLAEQDLAGKPAPDTFLKAARLLNVPASETAVVEDARVGVAAGSRGGFGLVIGVDRDDQTAQLCADGADIVVKDLRVLLLDGTGSTMDPAS